MPSHNYALSVLIPIIAVCWIIDPELARAILAAIAVDVLTSKTPTT
ncbi:hypothetical protein [Streptomyces sp. FxanaA7]|nr:hypothetical protein [Streptomyces sp. FxanaA7]